MIPKETGFYWATFIRSEDQKPEIVKVLILVEGQPLAEVERCGSARYFTVDQFKDWQGPILPTKAGV